MRKNIIKANEVCQFCKRFGVKWNMNLKGLAIYYPNGKFRWFPLIDIDVDEAKNFVLTIAEVNEDQTSLDDYFQ